jgi:hypothetical protein
MTHDPHNGWRLNRTVPVLVIIMGLLNFGGIVWWVRGITAQVEANQLWIGEHREQVLQIPLLEERYKSICETLTEIKGDLDYLKKLNRLRSYGPTE